MARVKLVSLLGAFKQRMFKPDLLTRLQAEVDWVDAAVSDGIVTPEGSAKIDDAAICVCTWGAPRFTVEILDQMPRLRLVVYAAGSIKGIVSDEAWARGITFTSGSPAIAINVAETMLGMTIVMLKNLIGIAESTREKGWRADPEPRRLARDMIGSSVGVIGAGNVGRLLLQLLRRFDVDILIYDPMLNTEDAAGLGGRKVGLAELMQTSDVVALAAPGIPATRHMIDADRLRLMKDGAALISAAAGSLIDEDALVRELQTGRIRAWLDCTSPEPPAPDNPLIKQPNALITQHIAGVTSTGILRIGCYVADEIERFITGREAENSIRKEQLDYLA